MNEKQTEYLSYKPKRDLGVIGDLFVSGFSFGFAKIMFPTIDNYSLRWRVVSAVSNFCNYFAVRLYREKYSLAHNSRIIINDSRGLESLLEKTSEEGTLEWGTLVRARDYNGITVIDEILDPEGAIKTGLVYDMAPTTLKIDLPRAEAQGYKGYHHFHPSPPCITGAIHFHINPNDKNYSPLGWINFLSFNLRPDGPITIAYNRLGLYIPKDPANRELVRATPEQVLEFLAA